MVYAKKRSGRAVSVVERHLAAWDAPSSRKHRRDKMGRVVILVPPLPRQRNHLAGLIDFTFDELQGSIEVLRQRSVSDLLTRADETNIVDAEASQHAPRLRVADVRQHPARPVRKVETRHRITPPLHEADPRGRGDLVILMGENEDHACHHR